MSGIYIFQFKSNEGTVTEETLFFIYFNAVLGDAAGGCEFLRRNVGRNTAENEGER